MIQHTRLLQFAVDEDDHPVMIYTARIGAFIDWNQVNPDRVLYIPKDLFDSVGRKFIERVGLDGYYGKSILEEELIEALCYERPPGNYSKRYLEALSEIRKFINDALKQSSTHRIVFEGP